ncbi:uncharacterized protein LOC110844763 isoform X2 [Folsomia candida]|uniref:uncharacterized protein LOC110844763 isoform X2 n=1 Tax=Folsomia candida TaxID=158441 RepID=UPI0016055445|nr:uncharacterized protein LOC110844763 isoform X2 [Folsomia candida]
MPYSVVIWKRGSNVIDIAGLKPDDLIYLQKIPCLSNRLEVDSEGFIRFGPASANVFQSSVKPTVILTALEVLGFKVVTTTATNVNMLTNKLTTTTTEYSWTLRREFSEPEPQD